MSFKKFSAIASVVLFSVNSKPAHAWGHLGHQTIATVASQLVQGNGATFWNTNAQGMGTLTNVPDLDWKTTNYADEAPTHWFQMDYYFTNPSQYPTFPHDWNTAVQKYTQATLISNGTATWRAQQLYNLAVAALLKKDYATGLQMAGAMSHYIEDLSQPLHVSVNYDGQQTGDPGIHAFFETTNLNNADAAQLTSAVTAQAKALLTNQTFLNDFTGSILDIAFNEINRSQILADEIINTDKQYGRTGQGATALLQLAEPRMADGAATLVLVLEQLSKDAGLTNADGATVNVATPAWVPPPYLQQAKAKKKEFYHSDMQDFVAEMRGYNPLVGDCTQ